jgi:OmpA-OmpF porin, OOP family
MRSIILSVFIVTLLCIELRPAYANHKAGSFYFSPVLDHWMEYQTPNLLDDGPMWGVRFGIDLCTVFGIESFALRGITEVSPSDELGATHNNALYDAYGVGARLNIPAGPLVPFLSVSAGKAMMRLDQQMSAVNNRKVSVDKKETRNLIVFGAGFEYFFHKNIGLRFDVLDHYLDHDFIDGDRHGDRKTHNWEFGVGLTLLAGGKEKVEILDSDGDGVTDKLDRCPGTPAGVKVYNNGCPVDSDRDGVADYLDLCPDTPQGVEVDEHGCKVEEKPEPVPEPVPQPPADSDNDGVPDDLDRESFTPVGAVVDNSGRAVDSDGDGVPDGIDRCPDTPSSLKVDKTGCPIVEPEQFMVRVLFDLNRSQVRLEAFAELNRVVRLMKENPLVVLEIIGYADHSGQTGANLKLSNRRARAVRDYLIREGMGASRIEITGAGEYPVDGETIRLDSSMQRCVEVRFKR